MPLPATSSWRRAALWLVLLAISGPLGSSLPVTAATPTPAASIGDEALSWIAVSPAYQSTGLVVAVAGSPIADCAKPCTHIWVSHDGGASWNRATARDWGVEGHVFIGVDGSGHETLYSAAATPIQRSEDFGESWTLLSEKDGTPTISPTYANDGKVAVAGPHPYIYSKGTTSSVKGSGGKLEEMLYMFSPAYPSGGVYAPALLAARNNHTGQENIQRCDAQLSCTDSAVLPKRTTLTIPLALWPSSDYASDGVVFAQDGRDIYKSRDGGASLTPLGVIPPPGGSVVLAVWSMAVAPGYREAGPVRTLYAAILRKDFGSGFGSPEPRNANGPRGVYRSDDGGTTWAPMGSPGPFDRDGAKAVAVAPDGRLFAGYNGVWCSTDGKTWQPSCPRVGSGSIAAANSGGTTGISFSRPLALLIIVILILGAVGLVLRSRMAKRP